MEGVVSVLTEIAYRVFMSLVTDPAVRMVIEGEFYTPGRPLGDRMPDPGGPDVRYGSYEAVMRLLDVLGGVEPLLAAYFLGQWSKIAEEPAPADSGPV